MDNNLKLAVIGGSGLYSMPELKNVEEHDISTAFGKPSSSIVVGELEGQKIAFVARHGVGHQITPGEVNYPANIYALKSLGVEQIVAVSACGSLREDYAPGDIVIPDQLYDNTRKRRSSFFGEGLVAHVSVADPFCNRLSAHIVKAVSETGATVHKGGSFITIEGPRFSTKAESQTFRSWGMSIIGMTTSPEAFLAREAEMCYGVMAHVTDYDVWHTSEVPVTVDMVFKIIKENLGIAQKAVKQVLSNLDHDRDCDCKDTLAGAITTGRKHINPKTQKDLGLLVDKYLS